MRSLLLILALCISAPAFAQISKIRAQAYAGDPAASFKYSKALYKGNLIPQDRDSAAVFLDLAKAAADVSVWKDIANAYAYGLGVDKSEDSAFTYLHLAASADDTQAQLDLAEAFRFGKGVTQNEDSANHYINLVAAKGDPGAQFLVGTLYIQSAFDASRYREGLNLLKKAAEQGHPQANLQLCYIFNERNAGTQSDKYYSLVKAYSYADAARQLGVPRAMVYCAEARLAGRGTTRNDSLGVAYMRKAADSTSYLPAKNRLGELYLEGTATGQQEPLMALAYFKAVKNSRRSNIDQRGKAEIGIHQVDQFVKQIQNYLLKSGSWVPVSTFDYRLRE